MADGQVQGIIQPTVDKARTADECPANPTLRPFFGSSSSSPLRGFVGVSAQSSTLEDDDDADHAPPGAQTKGCDQTPSGSG